MTKLTYRVFARLPRQRWRDDVTQEERTILEKLNTLLLSALATTPDDEKGCVDETDFHGLWIGLLLGSETCDTVDAAYCWSTFVRYHTDLYA